LDQKISIKFKNPKHNLKRAYDAAPIVLLEIYSFAEKAHAALSGFDFSSRIKSHSKLDRK